MAALAERQQGQVACWQLRELGFSAQAIRTRSRTGRLHRVHLGVYAVGHRKLTLRGRWMAAVLACGPDARLSHRSAAALWDMRGVPSGPIDVVSASRHRIPGIRCHHARNLDSRDGTVRDGIPVTTPARTVLDLAEIEQPQRLRTLVEAAQREELLDQRSLDATIARNPGRHGLPRLQAALRDLSDEPPWTQSTLERAFLELIRGHELPEPRINVFVDGELVDAHWPQQNLIVEVDGWKFHRTRRAFEDDHAKTLRLQVAGRRVARFTARQVFKEPDYVAGTIQKLLSGERGPGSGPSPVPTGR
jgi:very-short-patch-repair endonuclease